MTLSPPARRVLAIGGLGVAPWVVVVFPGQSDFVFFWGWINSGTWHVVTVWEYLFELTRGPRSLPAHLQAWPIAALLYCCAMVSAVGGATLDREDRRVTAGLLVLAVCSMLRYAVGFAHPTAVPVPVFVPATLAVCWWYYADAFGRERLVESGR